MAAAVVVIAVFLEGLSVSMTVDCNDVFSACSSVVDSVGDVVAPVDTVTTAAVVVAALLLSGVKVACLK